MLAAQQRRPGRCVYVVGISGSVSTRVLATFDQVLESADVP